MLLLVQFLEGEGISDQNNSSMSGWNNSTGAPWVWTPIWFAQTRYPNYNRVDFHPRYFWSKQKGIMAHEVGVAFGMAHTAYYYSIMCQHTDDMRVFIPQEIDLETFIKKNL